MVLFGLRSRPETSLLEETIVLMKIAFSRSAGLSHA
jgi:hypothetical protein